MIYSFLCLTSSVVISVSVGKSDTVSSQFLFQAFMLPSVDVVIFLDQVPSFLKDFYFC